MDGEEYLRNLWVDMLEVQDCLLRRWNADLLYWVHERRYSRQEVTLLFEMAGAVTDVGEMLAEGWPPSTLAALDPESRRLVLEGRFLFHARRLMQEKLDSLG